MTTRGSPPCNSHLQTLQAPGLLHAAPAHERKRLCTAVAPKQNAAASMPSPQTSELRSMRIASPHTHQTPHEPEAPSGRTTRPPMAQTHCSWAPQPGTCETSPPLVALLHTRGSDPQHLGSSQ